MAPSSDVLWRSQAALLSRWRDDRINDVDGTIASYGVIRRRKESKRAGTPQDAGQISGIDSLPQCMEGPLRRCCINNVPEGNLRGAGVMSSHGFALSSDPPGGFFKADEAAAPK